MNTTRTPNYRIFLSSTAIDMEGHREKVSNAILRMGDLPLQMEFFGALPNEPVEVCQEKVRECDALVVMVAHRYGWTPGTDEGGDGRKSMTWIEVETALEVGKPVFAFLVDMNHGWTHPKEQDLLVQAQAKGEEAVAEVLKNVQALTDFRTFLEDKAGLTREKFTSPEDLALKVVASLSNWSRSAKPEPGKISKQPQRQFRVVHPLQPAPHFQGRKGLLKDLKQWWKDPVHPDRVRSLVALGGTGKTALIERFLKDIEKDKLRGSVLVWSFYEEPDTDAFLREACILFTGEEGEGVGGRFSRLQRALSGSEQNLLVLDGLERVQSEGKTGHARGEMEDHRIKNLLRSIAAGLGRTRALITSRFKLTDLEQWEGAGYRSTQLDVLDKEAAVSLLRAWKVKGDDKQLSALAKSLGWHALSVSVLGSYLNHFCDGDPECAKEFKLEEISEDEPQAAKLGRVLAGYAEKLSDEERDLLIRLSVFPRGVSVELLGFLIDAGGEIAGALVGVGQDKLMRLAERLENQGLVYRYELRNIDTYTAHPFLREYFRDLLGVPSEKIHEVVRSKLAISLDSKPESKPRDSEMLDRYETLIEHSILAGHFQEALVLYENAMGGSGGEHHIYHNLCDYGRIIRIISLFAEDGEPRYLTPQLSIESRSYSLNAWGMAAQALGDLSAAERCLNLLNEFKRMGKDWKNLSQGLQNSAWVAMDRGTFPLARKLLIESLEYADADHKYIRIGSYVLLAVTYHALGEIEKARKNFTRATEIEGKPLYSIEGVSEAEHLFALGNKKKAYERTEANLTVCEHPGLVRDISLCHALLGLLSLPDSIPEARDRLQKVRNWTDQSGYMDGIIKAHILAAEIAYCAKDFTGALAEATTGLNQAEGCGYGKHAIDLLLQLSKIHLAIPDSRAALRHARKALDLSQHPECRYAWGEADGLYLCGLCHKELGEKELAEKRFKAAREIRKRIQHPGGKDNYQ